MQFELIRSRRRTLALEVRPDGRLIARAPLAMRDSAIRRFIQERTPWIERTMRLVSEDAVRSAPKRFEEGERFWFLGRDYSLHIAEDMYGKLVFEDRFILNARWLPKAARVFERWFREEAFRHFTERCAHWAPLMGVRARSIALSSARHRWGSCNRHGKLCFNWRLIMAPGPVIDYVVVHELAHIRELNHSDRFWRVVSDALPSYRQSQAWLKQNAWQLSWKINNP